MSHESEKKEGLGARIKRLMMERGVSQSGLAKTTGIDRTQLNRLVNEKREPNPDELVWLAQALATTVEAILDGVELQEGLRKSLGILEEAAKRALVAEGERDAARAELEEAKRAHRAEERRWRTERDELQALLTEAHQAHADALAQVRQKEAELRQQVVTFADERAAKEQEISAMRVENKRRGSQITLLQGQLAKETSAKNAAGLLGLAGLLGGVAFASRERE